MRIILELLGKAGRGLRRVNFRNVAVGTIANLKLYLHFQISTNRNKKNQKYTEIVMREIMDKFSCQGSVMLMKCIT